MSILSKTEEIQYLGQMLTATTAEDKGRLRAISERLDNVSSQPLALILAPDFTESTRDFH